MSDQQVWNWKEDVQAGLKVQVPWHLHGHWWKTNYTSVRMANTWLKFKLSTSYNMFSVLTPQ
jgi:hypothetical protein